MSWFDAASFTSIAKTALASAQKSIDKVLDIDEGEAGSSSQATKTTSKVKGDGVEKSSNFKTSTPKSTSPPKSSSSKEKLTTINDSSEASGGDFWSSFLGTSDSSLSSTNKTSSIKKPNKGKELLGRKKSDSKLSTEKLKKKGLDAVARNTDVDEQNNKGDNVNDSRKKKSEALSAGSTDVEQKIKKRDYNIVDNSKPNLLEKTQDEDAIYKTPRKSRRTENKESTSSEIKAASEPSSLQSSDNAGSSTVESFNNEATIITDEGLVDVCLEQNSDLAEKRISNESTGYINSQGINQVTTQSQELIESKVSSDEIDNALEVPSSNSDSIYTSTDLSYQQEDRGTESSLEPMATSTPFSSKESPSSTKLESNEQQTQGMTAPYIDTGNGEEESTFEERKPSENNDEERQKLESNEQQTQGMTASYIDTGNGEEESTFEERKPSENNDEERQGLTTREPTEDDCAEEIVKGTLFMSEDVLNNEESMVDDLPVCIDNKEDSLTNVKQHGGNSLEPVKETGDESNGEFTVQLPVEEQQVEESSTQNNMQVQQLIKEISDLKELVNARENKMVSLSKENIDYQETNAILRSQIEQLESLHAGENEEFEELREEFTTRIAAAENKTNDTENERDQMRTELEETTAHLTEINERQKEEYSTLIAEKDEQIAQLLAEGEKLSKQELQSNTVIKKLRAKEKENDALIKKQSKKLEEYDEEVKRLTDILTSRDDSNSKQGDAINKLNSYVKRQEEQLSKQASELEDANEKVRSMQVALDNAYKEMTSLQKQTASTDSTIQEAVLSTEMKAKEELRMALEKTRREFQQESEMMALQVTDLQASLTRAEQQSTRREENLRQEVKHLQQRLQEAEDRNQELATSVSHATRPLLRQIENLQTTHNGQTSTWEKVEKSLTERLNEAQNQLLKAQEKERTASQSVSEFNARISRLESQVSTYRAERSRLEADLELERTKIGTLEDTHSRDTAKYDAMVKKYHKILEDANLDKAHLEQQLTVERSKMDTELMKFKAALEDKEKLLSRQSSFAGIPQASLANSELISQDTSGNPLTKGHSRTSSSSSSVVDGITKGIMGGTTALVERLQAQVRQKDGEIELLQDDVTSLRQARDSVMEELTSLTVKLERLETSHEKFKDLKEKYDALQQRYNAVLQMYGEKEEEAEELRMDIQDVKSMYKQQLEQLFGSTR